MARAIFTRLVLACFCSIASAATVQVVNLHGAISIRTAARADMDIRQTPRTRPPHSEDLHVERNRDGYTIRCEPSDGAAIDLAITVPYRVPVIAQTKDGAISVEGFFPLVEISTETGELRIASPWDATRLNIQAKERPSQFVVPDKFKVATRLDKEDKLWHAGRSPDDRLTYGEVNITADRPTRIELVSIPIPADSTVKLPAQAPAILDALVNAHRKPPAAAKPKPITPAAPALSSEDLVFHSDVRVVNQQVAVYDQEGHPLTGLTQEDFEVLEDGKPQRLHTVSAEELPFNLALLLDLSGSTADERDAMKAAALRFLDTARPQDRVAIYALANEQFHVLSRLTPDREKLKALIGAIPQVGGGSPVYDSIVLSWAEELRQHAGERNALLILSDGVDNQLYGLGLKSEVSFGKLREGAAFMDTLIYPVFLDPYTVESPPGYVRKAHDQLQELATATGGKLFPAKAVEDLDPVYPQVAAELRSVYSIAYSPANQDFNGAWRKIEVRVKRPGARVRTRAGYFAY